jgi:hypothetical protein
MATGELRRSIQTTIAMLTATQPDLEKLDRNNGTDCLLPGSRLLSVPVPITPAQAP